jgi:hypothetical protein
MQEFAPTLERVAKMVAGTDHLTIAKLDFTTHRVDHPKLKGKGSLIKGFPTLVYFPMGKKQSPFVCNERMEDGLISFLTKHSSKPLQVTRPKFAELADAGSELSELDRRSLCKIQSILPDVFNLFSK